jgi:hypothetical protein
MDDDHDCRKSHNLFVYVGCVEGGSLQFNGMQLAIKYIYQHCEYIIDCTLAAACSAAIEVLHRRNVHLLIFKK